MTSPEDVKSRLLHDATLYWAHVRESGRRITKTDAGRALARIVKNRVNNPEIGVRIAFLLGDKPSPDDSDIYKMASGDTLPVVQKGVLAVLLNACADYLNELPEE